MAKWLMQFPALTLMVLSRCDVGYRLLNPLVLIAVCGILAVVAVLAEPGHEEVRPIDLLFFAVLSFCAGLAQRIRRWWELNAAVQQHSFYIGTSPLDFKWLPMIFRRNRRVARFIEPVFWALIGLALFPFSRVLGCYLVFAAFCLRAYEYMIHQRERNLDLDTVDGLIRAEAQGETVEQFENVQPTRPQQATGIPTGLGQDVREHIKRRKAK
jgi:hypothetical protein